MECQEGSVALQNRLSKYFNSFREENINGVPFNIMPPKEKVPLIKQCSYNQGNDVFEIVFDYKTQVNTKRQDNVIFIEDMQGRLVGIQIIDLKQKNIKKFTLEIITTLDNFIKTARVNFADKVDPEEIANMDLEERKMSFFKDVVSKELSSAVV